MPLGGLHQMINADLTLKKLKGKALSKALGEAYAPAKVLEVNRSISKGNPTGGLNIIKKTNKK